MCLSLSTLFHVKGRQIAIRKCQLHEWKYKTIRWIIYTNLKCSFISILSLVLWSDCLIFNLKHFCNSHKNGDKMKKFLSLKIIFSWATKTFSSTSFLGAKVFIFAVSKFLSSYLRISILSSISRKFFPSFEDCFISRRNSQSFPRHGIFFCCSRHLKMMNSATWQLKWWKSLVTKAKKIFLLMWKLFSLLTSASTGLKTKTFLI